MSEKREVRGIWKYLHHILSGFILLLEGILLLFWRQPIGFALLFIFIGGFLFVDDILAETKGISIFENLHSDPIRLKILGIIFFGFMELLFILVLIF